MRVVSPAVFRHYGIAYGDGIVNNLRRRPWLGVALPLFFIALRTSRSARRATAPTRARALAARRASLHSPRASRSSSNCGGRTSRWRRVRPAGTARSFVRRAAVVVCASTRARGRRTVARRARREADPCARRRTRRGPSAAGGATSRPLRRQALRGEGRPRPCRGRARPSARRRRRRAAAIAVPAGRGIRPTGEARSVLPSARPSSSCRRDARGTAWSLARPWRTVARSRPAVGGLTDAIEDGVTGLLVPPRQPRRLREALLALLEEPELRARLGSTARARIAERHSPEAFVASLHRSYDDAIGQAPAERPH